MFRKKHGFGQRSIVGKLQNLSSVSAEVFGDRSLRKLGLEAGREEETKTVVECDEPPIKCGIVQS